MGLGAELLSRNLRIRILCRKDRLSSPRKYVHFGAPSLIKTVLGNRHIEVRGQLRSLFVIIFQYCRQASKVCLIGKPGIKTYLIITS